MKAGDTFALKDKAVDSHLWVIVSDPAVDAERVLFVSMTSYDVTKEKVCLLDARDHPLIKHRTYIADDFAKVAPWRPSSPSAIKGFSRWASLSPRNSSSGSASGSHYRGESTSNTLY